MKLELIEMKLKELFTSPKIRLDYEYSKGCLDITISNIKIENIENIIIKIVCLDNGSAYIDYIFDEISFINTNTSNLINRINSECAWIKAYLNKDNRLILNHTIIDAYNEEILFKIITFILNYVGSFKVIELIKGIYLSTIAQ